MNTNASNRYFFPASRAHHAYSMAIDFGMEFEQRFGKWKPEGLIHLPSGTEYKLYVHPDSLHLLKPRMGDIVQLKDNHVGWVNEFDDIETAGDRVIGSLYGEYAGRWKTIQRNGIPFFWPEREP